MKIEVKKEFAYLLNDLEFVKQWAEELKKQTGKTYKGYEVSNKIYAILE